MGRSWIDAVRTQRFAVVARALGIQSMARGSYGPCPACYERARGRGDRRGPLGVTSDGQGWQCHRGSCGASGDVVDLISRVELSMPSSELRGTSWAELRQVCANHGWCNPPGDRVPVLGLQVSLGRPGRARSGFVGLSRPGDSTLRTPATPPDTPPVGPPPAQGASATDATGRGGPFAWRDGLVGACATRLWEDEGQPVMNYLRQVRKFSEETIEAWHLGCLFVKGVPWLTIPLFDHAERVVNVRFRSIPPADKAYRVCPGRPLPLFGAHQLGTDMAGPVVVVEGELDVIAAWQYGLRRDVVSGTAGAGAFKEPWLDQLEPYNGFVLAFDTDDAGDKGALQLAEKLGHDRCARATLPHKDMGECLVQGVGKDRIDRAIQRAQPMIGVEFRSVDAYADDLERLISNPTSLIGLQTSSERLNTAIGGLAPGLWVITGDTGAGKSTFANWLCFDLASKGVPVLVSSLENRPIGAIQKLVRMQLGGDFVGRMESERRAAVEDLSRLPLQVLHHGGELPPQMALNSISYAARRQGARVALLDHLGYVIPSDVEDERRAIDAFVRALAVQAYQLEITTLLIAHPKTLPEGTRRVKMNHLKGASAIKQEAFAVLVVQPDFPKPRSKSKRHWPLGVVHVDKLRHEFGAVGSCVKLAYGPQSCHYADEWEETPEGRDGRLVVLPSA